MGRQFRAARRDAGDGARGVTLPWSEFLAVWAFLAANIASPGPNVLNTIALAMGSGRMAGLGSATGVALGIGVWCLGMTYGVATAISHLPGAQAALTVVAVGLLVWFSARYLRAAHAGFHARTTGAPPAREGVDFAGGFRRSVAVNALNPKALTSWLAVLGFFPAARASGADIAILCAGASAVAFGLHAAYSQIFSTAVALRLYLRAGWVLQGTAGIFFAGFALKLAVGVLRGAL